MPGVNQTHHPSATYEIIVRGKLDESWSHWFSGMTIHSEASAGEDVGLTRLKGTVADQPALRGILTRLWDFNFEIISVKQVNKQFEME